MLKNCFTARKTSYFPEWRRNLDEDDRNVYLFFEGNLDWKETARGG